MLITNLNQYKKERLKGQYIIKTSKPIYVKSGDEVIKIFEPLQNESINIIAKFAGSVETTVGVTNHSLTCNKVFAFIDLIRLNFSEPIFARVMINDQSAVKANYQLKLNLLASATTSFENTAATSTAMSAQSTLSAVAAYNTVLKNYNGAYDYQVLPYKLSQITANNQYVKTDSVVLAFTLSATGSIKFDAIVELYKPNLFSEFILTAVGNEFYYPVGTSKDSFFRIEKLSDFSERFEITKCL